MRLRALTLGDKLLLTFASLLVLEAGIRGYVDWTRDTEACQQQFLRIGRDHVRNVAYTARGAIAKGDTRQLGALAELLRTPDDTDLVYVAFYDPDGVLMTSKTWYKTPITVPPKIQPLLEPTSFPGGVPDLAEVEHYTFVFPISGPTTGDPAERPAPGARSARPRSGIIAAVRSPQGAKAPAAGNQSRVLLVTAAMLAVCLNVLLVFSRRLVAPFESFVKGTERIAAGDFSTPIDVGPRRDELHNLADSFNRMLEKLKQQRDEILMHSRELERKVSERTAELVEANQRIRQAQAGLVEAEKMRMLGQLAAGVAHEINTPAAAMLNVAADAQTNLLAIVNTASRIPELPPETRQWLADLVPAILSRGLQPSDAAVRSRRRQLEQELKDGGHAEYRRMAAVIIRCGLDEAPWQGRVLEHLSREPVLALLERLEAMSSAAGITCASAKKIARIVRALSVYTRSDEKELVEADVNETLDNTLTILQSRLKHAADVRTEYAKGLPPVRCGADISQVWTNILNNACDAIEESSPGRLGRIDIVTARAGDRIRVTLFNTGKPIPDPVRERIFDPFFTTKPVGKGTGLGLSICAGILRDCGGTLRACNEPDGVMFEVTLPASTRKPAEAPVAAGVAADG